MLRDYPLLTLVEGNATNLKSSCNLRSAFVHVRYLYGLYCKIFTVKLVFSIDLVNRDYWAASDLDTEIKIMHAIRLDGLALYYSISA